MDLRNDAGSSWQPCPTGEVGGLVRRLRRRHRRRDAWRAAVAGASLIAVAALAFWMLPGQREVNAAITCREVHDLADEFVAGHVEPEKSDRIRRHLDHCRPCREVVERLRRGDAAALDAPVIPCPRDAAGRVPIADASENAVTLAAVIR